MRLLQPRRHLVVEIGQRALRQLFRGLAVLCHAAAIVYGADAALIGIGEITSPRPIDGAREDQRVLARPLRRVQPGAAAFVEFLRRYGDRFALGVAWLREGERLETSGRRVTETALTLADLCSVRSCPGLVNARMEYAEGAVLISCECNKLMIGQGWWKTPYEQSVF